MYTRAAVLRQGGLSRPFAESRPLAIEDVELAPPGKDEVVVRVAAAGLCHSDLSILEGKLPAQLPMVAGHEAAGVVEALGPGVDDLAVGDHVVMVFVAACGGCSYCAQGRPNLCDPGRRANMKGTLISGATRIRLGGEDLHHMLGVSCFAERAVVSRHSLVKIDKRIALEEAALFGCAVITGAGAVINTAGVRQGATVAVVGLGGVGLSSVMAARVAGAKRIVALDLLDRRLELARELGATDAFRADDAEVAKRIVRDTQGGVDFAFDAAGAVAALELAFRITRTGGTTVSTGLPPMEARMALPAALLMLGERTLKGSYMGSAVPARDVPRYIELYRQGRLPVDRLVSGRVGLDDLNTAFDDLADGTALRQVLVLE